MTASTPLAGALEAALPGEVEIGDREAAEATLASALAGAAETWPDVRLDGAAFAAFVGARLSGGPASDAVARLCLGDLALACACAAGDAAAIQVLDRMIGEQVTAAADGARASASVRDEAAQVVRTLLLLPRPERPPAILDYAGRGPLGGWLRITATREVVRLLRNTRREVELGDELVGATAASDPVLSRLKDRYRRELADAFHTALAELGPRDRTLLRYQLVDGLNIDDIAAIHRVHRATAARWLVRVREDLVDTTRGLLAEKLGLSDEEEVLSVLRLVRSELNISVIPHLRESLDPDR
jgi:RNA polymerase sigma-70 factor (ECF subfamily)